MTAGTDAASTPDVDGSPVATRLRVSRTVPAPPARAWEVLVAPAGAQSLFGPGASIGAKGQAYLADDGSRGVTRSIHPLEQLRVSWHRSPDAPAVMVEVELEPAGSGTTLELAVTGADAADGADAGDVAERFRAGLDELCSMLG
ncbi:MAG: SRPBCC domain-containing protein [Kineosporiaceae bacterium]